MHDARTICSKIQLTDYDMGLPIKPKTLLDI